MDTEKRQKYLKNCSKPTGSKCCVNYFFTLENNRCDPCPLGKFGIDCNQTCPLDYYGRLCELKCNCDKGIPCSPKAGCATPTQRTNHSDTNTIVIAIVLCLLCLAVGVLPCRGLWKRISKRLNVKAPGNNRKRTKVASTPVTNANYALTRKQSSLIIQEIGHVSNGPMEAIVGIYGDVSVDESDYVDLKQNKVEYRKLQVRLPNVSRNSDTEENIYEEYDFSSIDNKIVDPSFDISNLYTDTSDSAREMAVSYSCERDPGYKIATLEVQVHAQPEQIPPQ